MADPGISPTVPEPTLPEPTLPEPTLPEPAPGTDILPGSPPRPFPGERPLGADEPSAPYEEPVAPGTDPDDRPGAAASPGPRA